MWSLCKPGMKFGQISEMNAAAFQGSIILSLRDETNLIIPHTAIHSRAERKCSAAIKHRSQGEVVKWVTLKKHAVLLIPHPFLQAFYLCMYCRHTLQVCK